MGDPVIGRLNVAMIEETVKKLDIRGWPMIAVRIVRKRGHPAQYSAWGPFADISEAQQWVYDNGSGLEWHIMPYPSLLPT